MDCTHSHKLISLELDGRLGPDERAELHAHIAGCMPCASTRSLQRRASRVLRDGAAEPVPKGLAERVAEGVIVRRRAWRPTRLPLLRIAALLLLSFVIGGLGGLWVDASTTEARAGAAAEETRLAHEAAAWRQLGADEPLCAAITAVRRRQHQQQSEAAASDWARIDAESMAAILRLLPEPVATAWCESSGLSAATFKELCRRTGR